MDLEKLRARLADLQAANEKVVSACTEDGREPTDDETNQIDANLGEIEKVKANIERFERINAAAQPQPRKVRDAGQTAPAAGRSVPAAPAANARTQGFRSFGEFAQCVRA